jgi:hypothetical protein
MMHDCVLGRWQAAPDPTKNAYTAMLVSQAGIATNELPLSVDKSGASPHPPANLCFVL